MNKAKNGEKENQSNVIKEEKTKEISVQTEEGDNIYKNAKKIFLIKSKRDSFDSIILSKYIPIIFLMLISFYLYIKSLKGCELEESECLEASNIKKFYKHGYKLFLCSVIVGFILLLMFYNLISIFVEIPFLLIYVYFFLTYQGVDLKNHGVYNSILLTIVSFILFLLYLYLYKLFKSLYKLKIKKFLFLLQSLVIPLILIYYFYIQVECNNFYRGLNNLEI